MPAKSQPARQDNTSPQHADAEHLRGYVEASHRRLQGYAGQRVRDYLRSSRLLTDDIIQRYGFTPASTTVKTDRGNVWMPAGIVLPRYGNDGKLIAVHTRRVVGEVAIALGRSDEIDRRTGGPVAKYMTRGTPSAGVYGADALTRRTLKWVVFVEGEFDRDLLQARMDALDAPVAVITKGSASGRLSTYTLDAIRKTGAPVAILLDMDSAGQQGATNLIDELRRAGLPYAQLPNLWEQKDVTDAARAGVDVAGTMLAALASTVAQAGNEAERGAAPEYSRPAPGEDTPQAHAADAGTICKHMTNGFRRFLMAGWHKHENVPLLLELLIEDPGLSAKDLARRTGISRANISHTLNKLAAEGLVKSELCLGSSPSNNKGEDLKHNAKSGRKAVLFSVHVPTTDAERAVWVAYVERRARKYAVSHVGQDERTALELIDEAGLEAHKAHTIAAARASIESDRHDQGAEHKIRKRMSYLHRVLKDTSLAAVIPTANREVYTVACIKEHFEAVPLASKKVHALALGVAVDNFNACIRRHGFRPNATKIVETFRAGDLRRILPALRRKHLARVIVCEGESGEILCMPTDEAIERAFHSNEQITVHLSGANTYTYTGECQSPKPSARTVVPAELAGKDAPDGLLEARHPENPAERRFRRQFAPYVRVVDVESGVLEPVPHGTPLLLIFKAWEDETRRIPSTAFRALFDDRVAQQALIEGADCTPVADKLTTMDVAPAPTELQRDLPAAIVGRTPPATLSAAETAGPVAATSPWRRGNIPGYDPFPLLKHPTAPAGMY